jgi:hypothetical protein
MWVKESKYLGILLQEGRQKQLTCPMAKLWRCFHRVKRALDPHLPLPLRNQLLLIQSDILSIALYPTAVKDIDYKSLDVFINRLLNRVTGCSQRFTSATFLRAELGVPSSKYLGHMRALCYFWKLANTCWYKDSLLGIHGDAPIQRVVNMMCEYDLIERSKSTEQDKAAAIAAVRDVSAAKWKDQVKKAVLAVAAVALHKDLEERGLPVSPEPLVAPRSYVRLGGYKARSGVHWRWSLMKQFHKKHGPQGEAFLQEPRYDASGDLPAVRSLAEMLEKDECFPMQHSKCREGRKKRLACPLGKLWRCFHRVKRAATAQPAAPHPERHPQHCDVSNCCQGY